tara:strand:- start:81 stop:1586 length:1506 start_codon:yes stop_codon:yes gene_type:complete
MESRDIINYGKEGAAVAQDYDLNEETWFAAYREMMTIFLKQGGSVEEVSMQIRGDDLHLTMIGTDGNMLYIKIADFFVGKPKPPISGDYVVRARQSVPIQELAVRMSESFGEDQNVRDPTVANCLSTVYLSQQDHSRYRTRIVLSDLYAGEHSPILSIGLSSVAVPIRTVRVIANVNQMMAITTGPLASGSAQALLQAVRLGDTSQIRLPLVLHADSSRSGGSYWNSNSGINDVSLVCNYDEGIVYDVPSSEWDLTGMKFLGAVEEGGIKRALSKTAKKRPFGQLELHYSSEKAKARLKVKNLKGEQGEREYEEAALRFKDVGLVYEREPGQHVACADYGIIFDQFLSTRQGNPSIGRAIATAKENDPEATITELIGISARDELVVGFQHRSMTIACTMAGISRQAEFDDEYLGTSRAEDMRRTSEFYRTEESEEDEEPQTVEHQEPPSALYMKWKIYSDEWHQARGLPLPTDVGPVFMTYMNSGEMDQEDIDEYNRLLQE